MELLVGRVQGKERDEGVGENDERGGVWGGGCRSSCTVLCGMSSPGMMSEAQFGLRSSTRLSGVFRMR